MAMRYLFLLLIALFGFANAMGSFETISHLELSFNAPHGEYNHIYRKLVTENVTAVYTFFERAILAPFVSMFFSPFRSEIVASFFRSVFQLANVYDFGLAAARTVVFQALERILPHAFPSIPLDKAKYCVAYVLHHALKYTTYMLSSIIVTFGIWYDMHHSRSPVIPMWTFNSLAEYWDLYDCSWWLGKKFVLHSVALFVSFASHEAAAALISWEFLPTSQAYVIHNKPSSVRLPDDERLYNELRSLFGHLATCLIFGDVPLLYIPTIIVRCYYARIFSEQQYTGGRIEAFVFSGFLPLIMPVLDFIRFSMYSYSGPVKAQAVSSAMDRIDADACNYTELTHDVAPLVSNAVHYIEDSAGLAPAPAPADLPIQDAKAKVPPAPVTRVQVAPAKAVPARRIAPSLPRAQAPFKRASTVSTTSPRLAVKSDSKDVLAVGLASIVSLLLFL